MKCGSHAPIDGVRSASRSACDGSAKLPFVAGQIAPLANGKDKIEAFNQALLKLPTLVPNTAVVRADDLSGKDIHFDSAETRTLGTRYAEAMLRLQSNK